MTGLRRQVEPCPDEACTMRQRNVYLLIDSSYFNQVHLTVCTFIDVLYFLVYTLLGGWVARVVQMLNSTQSAMLTHPMSLRGIRYQHTFRAVTKIIDTLSVRSNLLQMLVISRKYWSRLPKQKRRSASTRCQKELYNGPNLRWWAIHRRSDVGSFSYHVETPTTAAGLRDKDPVRNYIARTPNWSRHS